jgi:hypothetical protein
MTIRVAVLKSLIFYLTLFLISSILASAQGDLLIFPKRLVFENGKKMQVINLSNTGRDTSKYNISFVQIRMNENGTFDNITTPDPGQLFADTFLRFYPRTVTLAPNESQVIKIQLTKAERLKPGEYRSHLYFRAIPKSTGMTKNEVENDTTSLSVHLIPVFGITIATIIRVGEPSAAVNLSNLSFEESTDHTPVVHADFNRTGNMSVYGDIEVRYISLSGQETKVGEVQGFAVYTPGTTRRFKMQLNKPKGIDYSSGKLKIIYSAQADQKKITLAEEELTL